MRKVSVIIPCYNQGEYVAEAINSVFNQTYKNIEIVVFNDASKDNSRKIIKRFGKKVVFIDEKENHGVIYARNKAIAKSTGEYILPLDADDVIEPTYIEKAVKVLDEKPDIGIVYCKARMFGAENKEWNLPPFLLDKFLYSNCIFCSALFRKSDFVAVGGYNENMKEGWEDWDFWLSLIEKGVGVYRIEDILFNYRRHFVQSRTDRADSNKPLLYKKLFMNHIPLYLNHNDFFYKAFNTPVVKKEVKVSVNINHIKMLEKIEKKIYKLRKKIKQSILLWAALLVLFLLYVCI